jgi:hypothetical protein
MFQRSLSAPSQPSWPSRTFCLQYNPEEQLVFDQRPNIEQIFFIRYSDNTFNKARVNNSNQINVLIFVYLILDSK